ncbi:MAG: DKNYY domain-containing protein [Parcubacteria group bacterium]|nr:DKNYY domain-containing protein [Parcubacteria group bacterium]
MAILLLALIVGIASGVYFLRKNYYRAIFQTETFPPIENNTINSNSSGISEGKNKTWIFFKIRNNIVYYHDLKVEGADVSTFQELKDEYAKDKNTFYYKSKAINNIDANSFVLVGNGFAKDKNHVFFGNEILNIEIDPAFFVAIDRRAIKDNKRVYFRPYGKNKYNLVVNADAQTFQYIGTCGPLEISYGNYYKDKNHIFVENESVNYIDVLSFQYLGGYGADEGGRLDFISYAKDKNAIYYLCGEILKDADKITFAYLQDGYAKDKNKVWYYADIISEADVSTFQSLGNRYAKDKLRVYFDGIILEEADISTFINVGDDGHGFIYAKDKNHVYNRSQIMEGVNPANCTVEFIEKCSE